MMSLKALHLVLMLSAGMSQYTKLTRKVHEHTAKLKALASSAMNGLKPDREDVESRLRMLNNIATCGKHVYVFLSFALLSTVFYSSLLRSSTRCMCVTCE